MLAHEAGHWEAHVDPALLDQSALPQFEREFGCLYRQSGPGGDAKERQAHQFMGFLLMPSHLLREAIRDVDLLSWPNLYALRDLFQVTITGADGATGQAQPAVHIRRQRAIPVAAGV